MNKIYEVIETTDCNEHYVIMTFENYDECVEWIKSWDRPEEIFKYTPRDSLDDGLVIEVWSKELFPGKKTEHLLEVEWIEQRIDGEYYWQRFIEEIK